MTVRLLLVITLVANVLVLVVCTEASAKSSPSSSNVSSNSSANLVVNSQPVKCRKKCNEPNEVLSDCVQPCGGEDSCYDRNQIICPAVVQSCRPACVCKEGYIRKTIRSECIPKEECGGPCEIFTEYSDCRQISKETCSSIMNPPKSNDEVCTPGCTCWDGYYRANETEPCLHRCFCPEFEDSPDCNYWRTPIE